MLNCLCNELQLLNAFLEEIQIQLVCMHVLVVQHSLQSGLVWLCGCATLTLLSVQSSWRTLTTLMLHGVHVICYRSKSKLSCILGSKLRNKLLVSKDAKLC